MQVDNVGQFIYNTDEVIDSLMQGNEVTYPYLIDDMVDLAIANALNNDETFIQYEDPAVSKVEFDKQNQAVWFMPDKYKNLNIAEHILDLCDTQEELQRCGEELLLYQDRDLFNLLRYMKYLVDTIRKNNIILGVGRGSSVASFVLYKLGVHKINSMYYDLPIDEFLR